MEILWDKPEQGDSNGKIYNKLIGIIDKLLVEVSNQHYVFKIKVAAGKFDFSWDGPGRLWTFPDGSTSTEAKPTRTLDADGVVTLMSAYGWAGDYSMNDETTDVNFIGNLADLPPLTYSPKPLQLRVRHRQPRRPAASYVFP